MKRLTLLALLFVAAAVQAQTGFPPYGSFQDGGFDAVNRQNLNVNFAVPIASVPGRGMNFNLAIVYNSLIWKKVANTWMPVTDPAGISTWGWAKGEPIGAISYKYTINDVPCSHLEPYIGYVTTTETWNTYVYVDAAGTQHKFNVSYTSSYNECTEQYSSGGTPTGDATDGSGYFININSPDAPFVLSPAGQTITSGMLKDTNGNVITKFIYSSTETRWIDTLGRIALRVVKKVAPNCGQDSGGVNYPECYEYITRTPATRTERLRCT